jgi:hypothetical protein
VSGNLSVLRVLELRFAGSAKPLVHLGSGDFSGVGFLGVSHGDSSATCNAQDISEPVLSQRF